MGGSRITKGVGGRGRRVEREGQRGMKQAKDGKGRVSGQGVGRYGDKRGRGGIRRLCTRQPGRENGKNYSP
jgi:hypothetical protein